MSGFWTKKLSLTKPNKWWLIILVLSFLFYWFFYRPVQIKAKCGKIASSISKREWQWHKDRGQYYPREAEVYDYDSAYKACLNRNGLDK